MTAENAARVVYISDLKGYYNKTFSHWLDMYRELNGHELVRELYSDDTDPGGWEIAINETLKNDEFMKCCICQEGDEVYNLPEIKAAIKGYMERQALCSGKDYNYGWIEVNELTGQLREFAKDRSKPAPPLVRETIEKQYHNELITALNIAFGTVSLFGDIGINKNGRDMIKDTTRYDEDFQMNTIHGRDIAYYVFNKSVV